MAVFLLTGCQSEHHSSPPPPPPPVVAAPVQPHKAITPAQWKAEADRWIGVKYRKGGTDRAGIDCWGLTSMMYLDVAGISLPHTSEEQFRCGTPVSTNDLRPGDLVFFISLSQHVLDHVGLYLGNTEFIHASPSRGAVVSSLRQDYYEKRFQGANRIKP